MRCSLPPNPSSLPRLTVLVAALLAGGCATAHQGEVLPPLRTVERVDLPRYLGTWYEIASYPQRFQAGCTATTATYSRRDDGIIEVLNRCRKGGLDGPEDSAKGRARVVDTTTNARLEVSFFGPFWGDYWVIDLAEDYAYAVVGHPNREYLWVLSRTPTLAPDTYAGIVARLGAQGYDPARLVPTLQPAVASAP